MAETPVSLSFLNIIERN